MSVINRLFQNTYLTMIHNFKELRVWQRSIKLAADVYQLMLLLPKDEKYGLISQMKRSAVSIASNIAEGCGRGTNPQLKQFLRISLGSAFELETQMILAAKLYLLEETLVNKLLNETTDIQRMLFGLERKL